MLSSAITVKAAICGLVGLWVTLLLTPFIRRWAIGRNLLDRAEQFHTTHTIAVPRVGGLALMLSFTAVIFTILLMATANQIRVPGEIGVIVFTCLAIFVLGFWDDIHPLGARVKLFFQVVVAVAVYAGGLRIEQWVNPFTQTVHQLGIWNGPLTVLWLVGVTNLINLVDGIDGLAAGLVFLIMILLAVVAGMGGNFFVMLLAVGMAGTLLAFLYYNFPPAKIFMGDGGAYFLGMLIAELALLNANKGEVAVALMVPFFALGLPIIDASFTILRRVLVGLPIFRADRRHIHHRLVEMGFSRQRVVLLLYAFCVFFSLLALGVFVSKGRLLPVFFGIFMMVMVFSLRTFGFVQNWYVLGRVLTSSVHRRKHTRYALLLGQLLLIETERCASLDELWKEFGFTLRKLGFCAARLQSATDEKRWGGDVIPDWLARVAGTTTGVVSELTLYVPRGQWDDATFQLLSELAFESWARASARWRSIQRIQG